MIDGHAPTTDGRELMLTRYTQPEPEFRLLLDKFKLDLPAQPLPRISGAKAGPASPVQCRPFEEPVINQSLISFAPLETAKLG